MLLGAFVRFPLSLFGSSRTGASFPAGTRIQYHRHLALAPVLALATIGLLSRYRITLLLDLAGRRDRLGFFDRPGFGPLLI